MNANIAERLRAAGVPGVKTNSNLSAIKVSTTTYEGGCLVSLIFVNGDPTPRYVLRTPRRPVAEKRLLNNFASLQAVRTVEALRDHVPEPVFSDRVGGLLISIESCVPGQSFLSGLAAARDIKDEAAEATLLKTGLEFLVSLHDSGLDAELIPARHELLGRLGRLADLGGFSLAQIDALSAVIGQSDDRLCCRVRCHNDFSPANLIILPDGRGIGVVDWEYSGSAYAILELMEYFWGSVLQHRNSTREVHEAADSLWDGGTALGNVTRPYLLKYAQSSGTPISLLRDWLAVYFALRLEHTLGAPQGAPKAIVDRLRKILDFEIERLQRVA
jgi:hypothetical protein